jgi:magnesium transporter
MRAMLEAAAIQRPCGEDPWIHVSDAHASELEALGVEKGFHPLDLEDCRHRNQMAKVVEHETYAFIVIKTIRFDEETLEIEFNDFDLFFKQGELVTVEEKGCAPLVERACQRLGRQRVHKPWRILHALLDVAVDDYLPVLDAIGVKIDELETEVLNNPTPAALHRALSLKRSLIEFRRNAAAMREVVNHLLRGVPREHLAYLRDVYDHLVRTIDLIETDRDLVSGALDIYLSSIANRTNEIVKVLTIYGTIALPLIVITGFYGMNLELPFQGSGHGLAVALGLMGASTVGVVLYFWRKGWM